MTVEKVTSWLDKWAPNSYQESYDNSGLLIGDPSAEVTGVVVSLDVTEEVVHEAIRKGANLIVAHHPIIFSGLKRITGKNYVERTVMLAIQNNVALYAIHTNLDNVEYGVNRVLSSKLGLENVRILAPKSGMLKKLVAFVPSTHTEVVLDALFDAGAGNIGNYDQCSFSADGTGTFRGGEGSDPFVGVPGERHSEPEQRIEVIVPSDRVKRVVSALLKAHPYEEVAWELYSLENQYSQVGSGMVGSLPKPISTEAFLAQLKETVGGVVRFTAPVKDLVSTIAVCGGSGSFLLNAAKGAKADVFVTADFKYHQFFDAEGEIVIADIGHFESEQFTIDLLYDVIREKFPNFATFQTSVKTNPILYL